MVRKASTSNSKRKRASNPRILIVTPEITYLPAGMGNMANKMSAKAGGLADVSASLVGALFERGADVHVALPHYRRMFHVDVGHLIDNELRAYQSKMPDSRIHLAEDRAFYYRDSVYSNYGDDNPHLALAFQREVINNIIGAVQPDLIHCNDWMTGLIPAAARRLGIPCLFTVHNIHTHDVTLEKIENIGIDAAEFWQNLYFKRQPINYEESRNSNLVDMMASGIFSSHFINTVSPTFLKEIVDGWYDFVPDSIRAEMRGKFYAGCATGVLNAPDETYNPAIDMALPQVYTPKTHVEGKAAAKRALQERLGLEIDPNATVFFWPSRLDPAQKGCQLLSDILYSIVNRHWGSKLQVAIVANGSYQGVFHDIVNFHGIHSRVAVHDFNEDLSRLGYAGSDFMLMPSLFEPCGLPQMVSAIYGSFPIVHDTGGLHDTIKQIDVSSGIGNGILFRDYDANALSWAIDKAMEISKMPAELKAANIERVMSESKASFNHDVCARAYMDMYEQMLHRPLLPMQ